MPLPVIKQGGAGKRSVVRAYVATTSIRVNFGPLWNLPILKGAGGGRAPKRR